VPELIEASGFFSADYAGARRRFRDGARSAGAGLEQLQLDCRDDAGAPLTIDIAWLGASCPSRVLIHSCGLHGVEGFAGSAIQLALLRQRPRLTGDTALALVHALNPYGMHHLRRTNEHNVDLNRNFRLPGEVLSGASDAYRNIETFLNPRSAPVFDFFVLRAAGYVLRYGRRTLTQAIAEGQYAYPQGLFYGGDRLEQGPALVLAWLREHLTGMTRVIAIDVHTGLGPHGEDTLYMRGSGAARSALEASIEDQPGTRIIDRTSHADGGYAIRGGYTRTLTALGGTGEACALLQEFGTCPPLRVLHALREENRLHHHGNPHPAHPAKRRLLEVFCPRSPRWRETVVARGVALAEAAIAALRVNQGSSD